MNDKLIAGYAAYTTADEYVADATGDAPGTTPLAFVSGVVFGGGVVGTISLATNGG